MIRYRRLYESENSDVSRYDIVRCTGYEWYVIDIDGDIVTLLAKNEDFGEEFFGRKSNNYKNSEVRKYLNGNVLHLVSPANPIPTRLNDVGVTDKVWLLSTDEAKKLPEEIRKFSNWWWLRTPGYYDYYAANIRPDGSVYNYGNYMFNDNLAVRPAMRVHIEDLED